MDEEIDPEVRRIDAEMQRQGRKRAEVGRLLGLDSSQVTRTFNGSRRLQRHEHARLLEWLNLSPPPAQAPGGVILPMPGLVPLYGWVGAASHVRLTLTEQNLRGYVPMHPNQANMRDAFALEVADVTMIPRYEPGEIVYLAPNRFPRAGLDCVVVTIAAVGLLKRFVRRTPAELLLHQLNPAEDLTIAVDQVEQIHTVVGRG